MGAEDTWKSFKTATDEDHTQLPKSAAEGILSDDMDVKNDVKVETKMKQDNGACKFVVSKSTSQDDSGKVSHSLSDDCQVDVKFHGYDLRVKMKPKEISKVVDLGVFKYLDDKLLVNPYVKYEANRNLEEHKFSLGKVTRYNRFKLNSLQSLNSWTLAYNLQWKHDNLSFAMKHGINLSELNFPYYNSKTTYTKDKTSVTLEANRDKSANLFGVDWVALHLHHNVCKGFSVAAKATKFTDDSGDKQLEVGYAWDLGNGGKLKMKSDLDSNAWTGFSFKVNDKASMIMTVQNNRGNQGQMNPSWKGYLGMPFNFGMKLKLEC